MTYARLIVNPAAGAGKTARHWPEISSLLKQIGMKFEHDITEAPGHAIELVKSAVGKGYKLIVSVGGDGTINEVVNGLYITGGLNDVAMGIIGTGTGGDYIRTIGVPRDYVRACERLMHPSELTVDLGMVEYGKDKKRLFANFGGLGFDAEIVRATTIKYKSLGGLPAYLMGMLTTLVSYHNPEMSLELDGVKEARKVCTIINCIGKYGGGSMFVAPNADPADGFFDVVIIGDITKPDLLYSFPRIYKGTHLTHPKITVKRVKQVKVTCKNGLALQADGELLGQSPAVFTVLPSALKLLV
ncbi:MAG: diacylglycerol kinase family lipid kinase [Dehalococcoidales bacterium]|nr:diacylglycerol kinase family lipid kinase [Dehalococcoidales bacterium]